MPNPAPGKLGEFRFNITHLVTPETNDSIHYWWFNSRDFKLQDEAADRDRRQQFLRDQLGRIENVEVKLVGEFLVEQLHLQLPFRKVAGLNRVPQVSAMEVGVGAIDFHRLVPKYRL